MRAIVVGLGIQGNKRRQIAGADVVATVDPLVPGADYRSIEDMPTDRYDAALLCIPDDPKVGLIRYLLNQKKNVLVEKPLWATEEAHIKEIEQLIQRNNVVCYTAYNHRFEPHFVQMRDLIVSGKLGKIYSCRMFYGNGTARLVRDSVWRDQGAGVLPDLGSHLLDTCLFWFGTELGEFRLTAAHYFENRAPDHVVISAEDHQPRIELEMTLCMWRNHFTCDVLAENGTAHIDSLCKWGPSTFTWRKRVFPSGRPPEESNTLVRADPTWQLEYEHFKRLCATGRGSNTANDLIINKMLNKLASQALGKDYYE